MHYDDASAMMMLTCHPSSRAVACNDSCCRYMPAAKPSRQAGLVPLAPSPPKYHPPPAVITYWKGVTLRDIRPDQESATAAMLHSHVTHTHWALHAANSSMQCLRPYPPSWLFAVHISGCKMPPECGQAVLAGVNGLLKIARCALLPWCTEVDCEVDELPCTRGRHAHIQALCIIQL
jgi:hypothetical protein